MTKIDDGLQTKGDPALAAAAERGDEHAFTLLYDRHAPIVWRFALATTGDIDEAGAVLVETFARVFTTIRAGRFSPDTTFRSLALTVARHTALDRARGRAADAPRFSHVEGHAAGVIAAAYAPLPERWRASLWLTEIEGMRAAKVAPVVGLATEAAQALAGRARAGLREQYLRADLAETGDRNCARAVLRLGDHVDGALSGPDSDKL